jgi:integrase
LVSRTFWRPGTYQTYRYQYDRNLAPRIAEIRLVELTTPLVDGVLQAIRNEVGVASAKTCKSILSGTFSLAVRHGALAANPVREIRIRSKARRRPPRALEEDEWEAWFELLRQDERAVRANLVDLCKFMLATGQRIGETLAVTWKEINRETGEVDCSHQIQRLRGPGLVRRPVKSAAGERILMLPGWALEMLIDRWIARFLHLPRFEGQIPGRFYRAFGRSPRHTRRNRARPVPRTDSRRGTTPPREGRRTGSRWQRWPGYRGWWPLFGGRTEEVLQLLQPGRVEWLGPFWACRGALCHAWAR